MSKRNVVFSNGEYYHIFNRGVARMPIFRGKRDYVHFLQAIQHYKVNPNNSFSQLTQSTLKSQKITNTVDIISYCLLPNHFHFILRQKEEGGISHFMKKLMNSYAKFFNIKYKRVGPLYQGNFKAVWIETTEQLLHVDRYIHLNPVVSHQMTIYRPEEYEWSSYREHLEISAKVICDREIIIEQFKNTDLFKTFTTDHIDYAKKLDTQKHLLIDH